MKLHLLSILQCPGLKDGGPCAGEILYGSLEEHPREELEIESGSLRCSRCKAVYPIIDGVPRLRPQDAVDGKVQKTRESFGFEWHRYPGLRREDKGLFLEETQIPESEWKDARVLDAGCGMGRYAHVALSLGAEVVAIDLSDSLTRLIPEMRENPRLHVIQGDLLRPPIRPESFDIIYSQGVIHHTADTQAAFASIARLVREEGLLSVWVYGSAGSYESFKTNPLRPGREWLKRFLPAVWALVWVRQIFSDFVRIFTTRLPVPLLYALCFPLTALGSVPFVQYLTFSVEPDFRVRLIENFDWLAPPFQTKHTKEEFSSWFSDAGYELLSRLPHGFVPKIGALGRRLRRTAF